MKFINGGYDSQFYKIIKYLSDFLFINLLFLVGNMLFFICFIYFEPSFSNLIFYILSLVPLPMATTALFYTASKIVEDRNTNVIKSYLRGYRENFVISLKFGLMQILISSIFAIDSLYFIEKKQIIIALIFGFVALLSIIFSLIGLSLLSMIHLDLKNLYKAIVVFMFNYFSSILKVVLYFISFSIIFYAYPSIMMLFVFALFAYFMMRELKPRILDFGIKFGGWKDV